MSYGIGYLKTLLSNKQARISKRYDYYEMKNHAIDMIMVRSQMIQINPVIGWCAKAVDALADRLSLQGWKNDQFGIGEIFKMNNPDLLYDSAVLNALITSCSFIYVSTNADGFPRLEVISGYDATGVIDPVTNLLEEGYAILSRDKNGSPELEAYFLPDKTVFYPKGDEPYEIANQTGYPLLVPIIYKPDAKRPFGHSRITRSMMKLTESAMRTIKRSEISAEFYSFPQKYILGVAQNEDDDAPKMDSRAAALSLFLQISKDEDGDRPVVGQFQQQSMQPHLDQIKTFAGLFAGESGLTMDDLGFVSDNPSSAEAIKASHETLRITAKKAQKMFGSCFLNVGFVAICLKDGFPYHRSQILDTVPIWDPIFEPDASALSVIGDGAIKLNQAVPGYLDGQSLCELTGIEPAENVGDVPLTPDDFDVEDEDVDDGEENKET